MLEIPFAFCHDKRVRDFFLFLEKFWVSSASVDRASRFNESQGSRTLEQFRGFTSRVKVHRFESVLVSILIVQLTFFPWCLGGMVIWAQIANLALSMLALFFSLLPREYPASFAYDGRAFRLIMWPKLLAFPIFWVGLIFLSYIIIQGLNPGYIYMRDNANWWVWPRQSYGWLPGSVRAPFGKMNSWRMLIIYSSGWMSVCAIWVGITRRRPLQILLAAISINAVLLAMLAIAQRVLGATKIFWLWVPPSRYFVASFIYKNHAGAYFNLSVSAGMALACWYYLRGKRRLEKSNPGGLFCFLSTIVITAVLMSGSRASMILLMGFLLASILLLLWCEFGSLSPQRRSPIAMWALVLVVGALVSIGIYSLTSDSVVLQMRMLATNDFESSVIERQKAAQATWTMFLERPVFGWGSGSFRYCFPVFQRAYPAILNTKSGVRAYWEHAHNDYVELLAEVGVTGFVLLLLGQGYWFIRLVRLSVWENLPVLLLVLGLLGTLLHCWIDFQFYNPATLTLWLCLWAIAARWCELEEAQRA